MIFYPDIETFSKLKAKLLFFKYQTLFLIQSQEALDANKYCVVELTDKCNRV